MSRVNHESRLVNRDPRIDILDFKFKISDLRLRNMISDLKIQLRNLEIGDG